MTPAYLAAIGAGRRMRVARLTAVYLAGVATVVLPITLGAALLTSYVSEWHPQLFADPTAPAPYEFTCELGVLCGRLIVAEPTMTDHGRQAMRRSYLPHPGMWVLPDSLRTGAVENRTDEGAHRCWHDDCMEVAREHDRR